jgi:thioredoxin reductase (NADPH)
MRSSSPTLDSRRSQMFPVLTDAEIERLRRYGATRSYKKGDHVFETGKVGPGMVVILSGSLAVTQRDGHGHDLLINEHRRGSFSGELGQLSGKPSFVDGTAHEDIEAIVIPPDKIRAVLIGEAELGERITRALILRRVAILETGAGGAVIIGDPDSARVVKLRNFLTRNGQPHLVFDPAVEEDARVIVEREHTAPEDLPLVVCPNGTILSNPSEDEVARAVGMVDLDSLHGAFDVIIAGAGPAGLSTAVYAASEGLSVLVVDKRAFGGQAGASMRIENYLGFPAGISGQALAGRAFTQAQKFGAQVLIPMKIEKLECEPASGEPLMLHLAGGRTVRGRTLVVATGAIYRRPAIPRLKEFEGRGVFYWASPIEAKLCEGEEIVLVGGGNSAGQAAVYLAQHAAKVWMLVRGPGLAATMSSYLIQRIAGTPNIEILPHTEVVALEGENELEGLTWKDRKTGAEEKCPDIRHMFLFVGADPATDWLRGCDVDLDDKGFVMTGSACGKLDSLSTAVPGVFAVGDVRARSTKRVGAAIGEGAAVVSQIHTYLATVTANPAAISLATAQSVPAR